MNWQHKGLTLKKWEKMDLMEQMANVGSEVERVISWRNKENEEYSRLAFWRALELLWLTVEAQRGSSSVLKELCRLREVLVDYFAGENQYGSSDKLWQSYFRPFNWAARVGGDRSLKV